MDGSLLECLQGIEDPRSRQGLRHPLEAVLALTVVAVLSGMQSLEAIAHFGKLWAGKLAVLLGFPHFKTPSKATLSRIFRRLDATAVEARLAAWLRAQCSTEQWQQLTLDGKTLRGSVGETVPAVHLLTAYAPQVSAVIAQLRVDGKTNEHKAALELLKVLPLSGKVVTADAMFTHHDVCAAIVQQQGDYLLPVKENQPTLQSDIKAAFADPPAGLSPPPAAVACGKRGPCRGGA